MSAGDATAPTVAVWRATLAGLCASLVGIGLARFAYTPLIPPLIAAGWFSAPQAVYLGAANLAGYLLGAMLGRPLARRRATAWVLRGMMLLAAVAFLACAFPLSFRWFFLWRLFSGIAGGALMVLAAPSVLPHVPPARQGLVGGAIFTGVGLGIAASGTLVPILLRQGLFEAWIVLGLLSLFLTAVAWGGWPSEAKPQAAARPTEARPRPGGLALNALYLEYGLVAFGLVPHMVFLVVFIANGLGRGLEVGSAYWVVMGIGALGGAVAAGALADRIGFRAALRIGLALEAVAVALLALSDSVPALTLSSAIAGALVPGIVPLVLGRARELLPGDRDAQTAAWSVATATFALGQAAAAYGFSYLFEQGARYETLFAIAAAAAVLALVLDHAVGAVRRES